MPAGRPPPVPEVSRGRRGGPRGSPDRRLVSQWVLAAMLLAGGALRLGIAPRTALVDDAYIHLRYARNLASGDGLVFHPGEAVLALSGPFYPALLSPFFLAGIDVPAILPYLSIAFDLAAVWLAWRLARRIAGVDAGLLAAAIGAFFPWLALACGHGMEAQLFAALVFGAFAAAAEGRFRLAALACGVSVLTRVEGLLASALVGLVTLRERRRSAGREPGARGSPPLASAALIWAACVLPWVAFAAATYGSVVPTSIAAKSRLHTSASAALDYFVAGNPFLLLLWIGAAAGVYLRVRRRFGRPAARSGIASDEDGDPGAATGWLLCAGWAAGYLLFFLAGRPSFLGPWYRPPLHPALAVLAAVAASQFSRTATLPGLRSRRLLLFGSAAWVAACALAVPRVLESAREQRALAERIYVPMSRWVLEHTAARDTVMCGDIGHVGYLTERRILDLGGLVTPGMEAHLSRDSATARFAVAIALSRRPRAYLAPDREFIRPELARPEFLAAYRLSAAFPPLDLPPLTTGGQPWRVLAFLLRDGSRPAEGAP